jgi:hypothetical protein
MPIYNHICLNCRTATELIISFTDYADIEKEFGRSESGNIRFPCGEGECNGWSERDYSLGVANVSVKGGYLFQTRSYRADAEHEWMRKEIAAAKNSILGGEEEHSDYNSQRPYAGYTLDEQGAKDMGFNRVSDTEAKARAEVSKKSVGKEVEGVEKARKSTIIED